jgi:hypothetical protein
MAHASRSKKKYGDAGRCGGQKESFRSARIRDRLSEPNMELEKTRVFSELGNFRVFRFFAKDLSQY